MMLRPASIEAAVRGVLCYGGCPLGGHTRCICHQLHLPPGAEKCSRTTCNREITSSRCSQRSSRRRSATTESVRHNSPDRRAVALQDFESEHGHRNPNVVGDCLAGGGGPAEKNVHPRANMSP